MAPLSHKKGRGTSKLCFTYKGQSGRLNFELSYNERTLHSTNAGQASFATPLPPK